MDFPKSIADAIRPFLLLALCTPALLDAKPAGKPKSPPPPPPPEPIFVMAYNVENLFDSEHDEGKDDWTYLPLAAKKSDEHKKRCEAGFDRKNQVQECEEFDWSENELKTKLERIGKIISGANQGKCPDILFLEEVENIKVLERLRTDYLKACNYKPGILVEGSDRRGIDAAMLSRFEQASEPRLHEIDFVESRKSGESIKTRGLLQANFKLPNGDRLTAFGVHFPAPYHPFIQRREAMEALTNLAKKVAPEAQVVIAAGDFNTNAKEDSRLYRKLASPDWLVSHLDGCRQCLGTHYYKRDESWSFLDTIMVLKGGKWDMDTDSVNILNKGFDFQTNPDGTPISWEDATKPGQSDHLPITLLLKLATRPELSKSR